MKKSLLLGLLSLNSSLIGQIVISSVTTCPSTCASSSGAGLNNIIVNFNTGTVATYSVSGTPSYNGGTGLTTYVTSSSNNLVIGDYVVVTGNSGVCNTQIGPYYNGLVIGIVNSTTFTLNVGNPASGGSCTSGGTIVQYPFCDAIYGVLSGQEIWLGQSINSAQTNPGSCSIALTGLDDGSNYYIIPEARPNPDTDWECAGE